MDLRLGWIWKPEFKSEGRVRLTHGKRAGYSLKETAWEGKKMLKAVTEGTAGLRWGRFRMEEF